MGIAAFAVNFGSTHEKAVILRFADVFFFKGLIEAGPSSSRSVLGRRVEQGQFATNAKVNAVFLVVP
jgi:hypothetical protein